VLLIVFIGLGVAAFKNSSDDARTAAA